MFGWIGNLINLLTTKPRMNPAQRAAWVKEQQRRNPNFVDTGQNPPTIWGSIGRTFSSLFSGQEFFTIYLKDPKATGVIGYGIGGISDAKKVELTSARTDAQVMIEVARGDAAVIIKLAPNQKKASMKFVSIPVINILATDEGPLPQ